MENYEIREKTFHFAQRAVKLHNYLIKKFPHNLLSDMLLDEVMKMGRAAEIAAEEHKGKAFLEQIKQGNYHLVAAMYYIRLLRDTEYLDNQQSESLLQDCQEIHHLLNSILNAVQTG